jgi:hypothetical protein
VALLIRYGGIPECLVGKRIEHGHRVDASSTFGSESDEVVNGPKSRRVVYKLPEWGLVVMIPVGALEDDNYI